MSFAPALVARVGLHGDVGRRRRTSNQCREFR